MSFTRAVRNILLLGLAAYTLTFSFCAGINHGARATKGHAK